MFKISRIKHEYILFFRVFAGNDMYRSLTPLNMDYHSSGDSTFNAPLKADEATANTIDINTFKSESKHTDEKVFGSAAPRGPLAALTVSNINQTTIESSTLDMVKINLDGESNLEFGVESDSSYDCHNKMQQETVSTNIDYDDMNQKSFTKNKMQPGGVIEENDPHYLKGDVDTNSSVDRTIVDSDFPSLPTDNSAPFMDDINSGICTTYKDDPNTYQVDSSDLSTTADTPIEQQPVSLSDIKLEEDI